jgi:hypothetical protein
LKMTIITVEILLLLNLNYYSGYFQNLKFKNEKIN